MRRLQSLRAQFIIALIAASLVSLALFAYGAWRNQNFEFNYLVWNLFLAWLPLIFAIRLLVVLSHKRWSSWEGIAWSLLWLVFLPNSFYMISDFIHLRDVRRVDVLYDTVMFTAFIYTGVAIGFSSLFLVHRQLRLRISSWAAGIWVAAMLLICSAAVYIGRDLRWNSWDILTNPGGLLFDISDRLIHPAAYPQMLITIFTFFILLSSMYYLLWQGTRLLQHSTEQKVRH